MAGRQGAGGGGGRAVRPDEAAAWRMLRALRLLAFPLSVCTLGVPPLSVAGTHALLSFKIKYINNTGAGKASFTSLHPKPHSACEPRACAPRTRTE